MSNPRGFKRRLRGGTERITAFPASRYRSRWPGGRLWGFISAASSLSGEKSRGAKLRRQHTTRAHAREFAGSQIATSGQRRDLPTRARARGVFPKWQHQQIYLRAPVKPSRGGIFRRQKLTLRARIRESSRGVCSILSNPPTRARARARPHTPFRYPVLTTFTLRAHVKLRRRFVVEFLSAHPTRAPVKWGKSILQRSENTTLSAYARAREALSRRNFVPPAPYTRARGANDKKMG